MNTSILNVSEILNNATKIISAGFSAGYNFNEEKADLYIEELVSNSEVSPIFSGILILEKDGSVYSIVDGLQRIITVNLLLFAMCQSYKGTSEQNEDAGNKILTRFILHENKPKLKLKGIDKTVFEKIILSKDLEEYEKNNNIFITYITFLNKLSSNKINPNKLFKIISQIQFMTVFTEKSEISTRELYQAINENKGESQLNLISDFASQQGGSEIWEKTIELFNGSNKTFENFIKDYLTTRINDEITNKNALYNNFKNFYHKMSKYQKPKEIFENIHKYANYYIQIIAADFEQDEIRQQMIVLNRNDGKDTYPYLMEVLDDLENGNINESALLNILMMINLFIKSRDDITIENVRIDFASLSKELNKMLLIKDYVPTILAENKLTINEINNLANFQ